MSFAYFFFNLTVVCFKACERELFLSNIREPSNKIERVAHYRNFISALIHKMSGKGSSKTFTKEEELLLQDFSRNVSTKSSALFYGNAFIVSAVPICK